MTQATSNPAYELKKKLEEVDDNDKYEPLSTSSEQKTTEQQTTVDSDLVNNEEMKYETFEQTAADGDPVNDEKMEYEACDQMDSQPQVQEPLYEEL